MTISLPIVPIALPTPWPAVGPVHVYLVRQDPITLIDTGVHTPESREALQNGLREAGVRPQEIARILLTHAHLDHYGQAGWLQATSGATVWMHHGEVGKVETPQWWETGRDRSLREAGLPEETIRMIQAYWTLGRRWVTPLEAWCPLEDAQRIPFENGELQAVHLPGHALGHTGFLDAASGTLIGGDHLLNGVTPNPIMEPVPSDHPAAAPHAPHRALTLGQFLGALERVAALPARQVLPGHGSVITDHVSIADLYRRKHERRLDLLRDRLGAGRTVADLTHEVYPKVRQFDIFLALSEVMAHVDVLVARGRATVEERPDGMVYRAV